MKQTTSILALFLCFLVFSDLVKAQEENVPNKKRLPVPESGPQRGLFLTKLVKRALQSNKNEDNSGKDMTSAEYERKYKKNEPNNEDDFLTTRSGKSYCKNGNCGHHHHGHLPPPPFGRDSFMPFHPHHGPHFHDCGHRPVGPFPKDFPHHGPGEVTMKYPKFDMEPMERKRTSDRPVIENNDDIALPSEGPWFKSSTTTVDPSFDIDIRAGNKPKTE